MNNVKRALALMLCLCMVLSYVPFHGHAASSEPNITISVDKTEVEIGDTITVKLGIKEMRGTSLSFGFDFDNTLLECTTTIRGSSCKLSFETYDPDAEEIYEDELAPLVISSKTEVNNSGHFGVAYAYANPEEALYFEDDAVITLKFTALAAGTVEFLMFEDSSGTDGYQGKWTFPAAPECEHTNVEAVSNGNDTHNIVCECGETITENIACFGGAATCTEQAKCSACGDSYGSILAHKDEDKNHVCDNGCDVYQGNHADGTDNNHLCDYCQGAVDGEDHTAGEPVVTTTPATCTEEGSTVTETFCTECGAKLSSETTAIPAGTGCEFADPAYTWSTDYSTCTAEVKCQHGTVHKTETVNTTSTVKTAANCTEMGWTTYTANFEAEWAVDGQTKDVQNIPTNDNHNWQFNNYTVADDTHTANYVCGNNASHTKSDEAVPHSYTDHVCVCGAKFTGWEGKAYYKDAVMLTGWQEVEGAWYYFGEENGARAEGLTRVSYPEFAINGITYAPDAEAVAYDPSFIDAAKAWFVFDEDGKFNQTTGLIGTDKYAVQGMLAWHPGLILIAEDYYYFIGDSANGGNIAANGDTYITRNNGIEAFKIGDIYNFENGMLSGAHGIVTEGTVKKYYENSRLMVANGLTQIGENYIYVRSNGQLVVDAEYYVPANALGVVPGTYSFDENGFLVEPEMTEKNGIVAENGGLYFYENGKIAFNKGLIEYNGGLIYVRSNGQLAVGEYYITNLVNYNGNDVKPGDKVTFGADGFMVAAKNGIIDGYYYVNGKIAYNAGVVEIEDGKYIYVRSNGMVVMDQKYWITNVGDSGMVAKQYTFDENGIIQNPEFVSELKNGIIDGYYYENGNIAYGAGLIEYNGGYIYVRSNGQIAIGKYWVTNTNGLKAAGYYTFGEDGMLID